jgi:hypothetical protein
MPIPTPRDFLARALFIPCKSIAIRAGLSVAKLLGKGTGDCAVNVISTIFPGKEDTLISCNTLLAARPVVEILKARDTSTNRPITLQR